MHCAQCHTGCLRQARWQQRANNCMLLRLTWDVAAQLNRYTLMNSATGAAEVKVLSKEQEADTGNFRDKDSGAELEVQEKTSLLEWLANSYKKFGCALEFVTNKSQEARLPYF